jgi:hypothetical protein
LESLGIKDPLTVGIKKKKKFGEIFLSKKNFLSEKYWMAFDENKDGKIDFREFVTGLKKKKKICLLKF